MRKTLIIMVSALLGTLTAGAQEVTSYETDSTAYYNAVYNPSGYAQAPVRGPQRKVNADRNRLHATVNTGIGVGGGGSYEYVNPRFTYDLNKKWSLDFGMGISYSNLKFRNFANAESSARYENLRAVTNYYSVGATYRATEKLTLYGDLIYAKRMPVGGGDNPLGGNNDAYMATFGAMYQVNKAFSIGFEVQKSRNVNPYGLPGNPSGIPDYGIIYNNPYSPW